MHIVIAAIESRWAPKIRLAVYDYARRSARQTAIGWGKFITAAH